MNGGKFFNNAPTPAALAKEPALVHYASQYTKDAATTPTASETVNVILTPDGITEQKWFTDLAGLIPKLPLLLLMTEITGTSGS